MLCHLATCLMKWVTKNKLHSQQSHVCFLNMLLQMSSVSGQCRLKKANSHYAKTRTEGK